MKISFIGAGKVGTAFGKYLKSKDMDVLYYLSKNYESSKTAAEFVGSEVTEELETLVNESEIIFITTSDDQIQSVAEKISKCTHNLSEKIFVHMSGALTSEVLSVLTEASVYSLHPLQTFSDIKKSVNDLETTYFALESNDDLSVMIKFVEQLGNQYFVLHPEQKVKYHLSACIFSNYLVTLMDFGIKMLTDIGIDQNDGINAMNPLVMATYNNIKNIGTKSALTGPIQRGDTETIEKHLEEITGIDLETYKILGKMTTERLVEDSKKQSLMKLWER